MWLMLLPQWLMELPLIGWCNCHIAVGTPIMTAYVELCCYCGRWNSHVLADVIASMLWQMELPLLADVIANMADGIAICV